MAPNSRSRMVLSNADPKRTFLKLVPSSELPDEFLQAIRGIKMDGPCAKVNFVLSEEPRFTGTPAERSAAGTLAVYAGPSLEFAERCYDIAKFGEIPEELWVDCVVASNADSSLAPPGRHILTCFVQYVPYRLRDGRLGFESRTPGRPRRQENRRICAKCAECHYRAASFDTARSGTHLWAYRRKYFSRRIES